MDEGERLKDDLSQCGCDTCVMKDKTSNSVQACSDLAHVVLVLVGVRRVTVIIVHIGLEGVLVVIHFCVAILFVIFCIRRCSLYTTQPTTLFRSNGRTPLLPGPRRGGDASKGASLQHLQRRPTTPSRLAPRPIPVGCGPQGWRVEALAVARRVGRRRRWCGLLLPRHPTGPRGGGGAEAETLI